MKNSTEMVAMLGQSGLGLPDRDYYLKNDAKFKKIRSQYLKYIEKTLSLAGDKQAAQHAQGILKLETQIAKIQWSNVQNRDVTKLYNIYKTQDLAKLSPKIDWQTYLEKQELSDKIKTIQVIQPSYFKGLSPIVDNTSLEVWKAYFKFHLVSDFSSLLSQAFVDNSFDFYSKQLREIKEQKPRWKRGVQLVEGTLGESLGQIYVKKYFSAEKKQRMEVLVQNLMKAYSQSIDKLDWMSPTTKVQAQKKLASFAVKIGYPNKWRDYSALEIKNNDLIGNVIRSREFEHQYALNKLGKPVDRDEWGMTPQTINAYYNASLNEIVFPAAILQPPFFDMDADDAVNYGAIGAIIGHEISHGFDDQGSQFDELGNMKNWWTAEDHRKFKEKTNTLVAQYNAYEPIKGYHVNGELTLGENIADNSGLAIAYKAYQLSLNGKAAPVSVKQGIGAYQCTESNGQQWYVSIEPLSERKLDQTGTRVVNLQTKVLSLDELNKFYNNKSNMAAVAQEKKSKNSHSKSSDVKSTDIKTNNSKNAAINSVAKTAPVKVMEEKKPVAAVAEEVKEKLQPEKTITTPQSQQMQLYISARKELGRGQNQINACNNAERAYNYGRLHGTSGINVYAESGVLVARCLTNVPSYSQRFSNPQDRAKRILQNLAGNQNHAVAKHMLKQIK
ncbi:hypothetical protein CRE_21708 [Caenorhabditis remanei]|uniref:Peptidase M13 C-terminal domain-containing protein n=1 Tax=Caenorhabditis remanei TaxID=31234 RepID=E3NWD3_CAERE|nr:hypothetical protein CRE_21708 [Caenorhabditis remanei]